MLSFVYAAATVFVMAPAARQIVQFAPTGPMAVSQDGYVAMVDHELSLHIWHLPSRALVRTIPPSVLSAGDDGVISPTIPMWDDATHEILIVRGHSVLGIDV